MGVEANEVAALKAPKLSLAAIAERRAAAEEKLEQLRRERAGEALKRPGPRRKPDKLTELIEDQEVELQILSEAELETERRAREAAAAEAEKRKAGFRAEINGKVETYFAAVGKAEKACRDLAAAITEAGALGRDIEILCPLAGIRPPMSLSGAPWDRRMSERISAVLKGLAGNQRRFGDLTFTTTWRAAEEVWGESERIELAGILPRGNGKDQTND